MKDRHGFDTSLPVFSGTDGQAVPLTSEKLQRQMGEWHTATESDSGLDAEDAR